MISRLLAFGFGFIAATLLGFGVLLLSRADGGAYQFDRVEARLSDGRMNTSDEYSDPPAKPKTVWNSQIDKDTSFAILRFAPRNIEQELWLYVRTHTEPSKGRLFGAMRFDRNSGGITWLALDPVAMNEFMVLQASRIQR